MPCIFDDTDIRYVLVLKKEIECGRGEVGLMDPELTRSPE
jgi:hypothetical protein